MELFDYKLKLSVVSTETDYIIKFIIIAILECVEDMGRVAEDFQLCKPLAQAVTMTNRKRTNAGISLDFAAVK